jgi:amino acid permease
MKNTTTIKNCLPSALLITGTCIGAGMLGIPQVTGLIGLELSHSLSEK